MFRDLKEYQKLQKLYEEVSNSENIKKEKKDLNIKDMSKYSNSSSGFDSNTFKSNEKKSGNGNGNGKGNGNGNGKGNGNGNGNGGNGGNGGGNGGGGNGEKVVKKVEKKLGKKQEPVKSPMEAGMGDGAAKAREIAKKRIDSGKTIADVKAANTQSMRDRARARNDAFKQKQQEFRDKKNKVDSTEVKKLGKKQEPVKSPMDMRDEYEPYDIVLEYLLSTQQAATIEEANYIMTEMDAKTIQDIVSQQLNEQN